MSQIGQYLATLPGNPVLTITGSSGGGAIPPDGLGNINLTAGAGITCTGAGNAITIAATGALGTTNHAVQVGNAMGGISSIPLGTTGTILAGVTGADPAFTATPTVTTIYATTFDTNVAAAGVTLAGTTLSCDGTDANINLNFSTKGTGAFIYDGINTGWAQSEWRMAQVSVQTNNATPTNILAIPLVNSLMVSVKMLINGFQDDYTDCLGGEIMVTAYRSAAGNITLVGAPIINVNYTDTVNTSDIDANVDVGTQSLQLQVIGVAAENWNWVGTYQYMYTISNL